MKYLLLIGLIFFIGCEQRERIVYQDYEMTKDVREFCYKKVKYLQFGLGTSSWGTVKMPLEKCIENKKD